MRVSVRGAAPSLGVPLGQGIQAFANLLLLLGAARGLAPADFAYVSIAWMWYAVLLTALRTILSEQVLVATARQRPMPADQVLLAGGTVIGGSFLATSLAGLLVVTPGIVAIAVSSAGMALLINDSVRYFAISAQRYRSLIVADTVLSTIVLFGFAVAQIRGEVVWVLAGPVGGAILSILVLKGIRVPSFGCLAELLREMGGFLYWVALQVFVINLVSQLTSVLSIPIAGAAVFAGLRAVQAMLAPLSTPVVAFQPLMFAAFAKMDAPPRTLTIRYFAWFFVVTAVFLPLGLVGSRTAEQWIPAVLGDGYTSFAPLVLPVVLTLGMVYVALPGGVHMRVLRLGRELVGAQLSSIAVGAVAVTVMTSSFGIAGAAWGLLLQSLASVGLAYWLLLRHLMRRHGEPATVAPAGTSRKTRD